MFSKLKGYVQLTILTTLHHCKYGFRLHPARCWLIWGISKMHSCYSAACCPSLCLSCLQVAFFYQWIITLKLYTFNLLSQQPIIHRFHSATLVSSPRTGAVVVKPNGSREKYQVNHNYEIKLNNLLFTAPIEAFQRSCAMENNNTHNA